MRPIPVLLTATVLTSLAAAAADNGAPLTMDSYSRLTPATNRFPSATGGLGFKPLADYVHSKALTFGIHMMRGIPRQAVTQRNPVTMQWCEKECTSAVNWAREQPPGEWRERLLSRASFVLSKSDPAAAANVVSGLEPGTVQDESAMAVLHQWALKDSSAALRWAEAFPESNLRDRALAEISNLRNLASSLHALDQSNALMRGSSTLVGCTGSFPHTNLRAEKNT